MKNVFDILKERGFIAQATDEESLSELLLRKKINFYIGFDPTASSLHIGSLVPIMAMMHMQRQGHKPVVLIGGGTGLIGDPSGKTEMRQLLDRDKIDENARGLQNQLVRYIDFQDQGAYLVNNADWLVKLNYIEFLRDIGRHFSVNKMLAAESYRIRLEKGLNLIEFNYMLLQAYDFLHLFEAYDCPLQMGGNDQWGNIVAGIDLIRRVKSKTAYGITFPLLVTAQGQKMGKTEKGTLWLDHLRTSPYDYYQYWMNTDDADVEKFLSLFTFLPLEEIKETRQLVDVELNMAKAVLAFEATSITHGREAARSAFEKTIQLFGACTVPPPLYPSSTIPRPDQLGQLRPREGWDITFPAVAGGRLETGIPAFELFHEAELCSSRGEARRLIAQGGGYVNDRQLSKFDELITITDANEEGVIILRKGKKNYCSIKITDNKKNL